MELKEALAEVRKGKIVFDGGKNMKYFLFMSEKEKLYYVHNETINFDKMKIAQLENSQPDLLAENWWKNQWEIWNISSTKTELTWDNLDWEDVEWVETSKGKLYNPKFKKLNESEIRKPQTIAEYNEAKELFNGEPNNFEIWWFGSMVMIFVLGSIFGVIFVEIIRWFTLW